MRGRFQPVAGAFRNAYDFGVNLAGELFAFDSDMEWDIGMPWYREIRPVHVVPGGDYGYRNGSGKLPPYLQDTLPPVRDVGRGSPVGVEFYQSRVYPSSFADALLEADWSRGRLLYTPLTRKGATYVAAAARTELVHGEPLNITDVEVGPDGLVWFTTGGRLTEGGVYRVTYAGAKPAAAGRRRRCWPPCASRSRSRAGAGRRSRRPRPKAATRGPPASSGWRATGRAAAIGSRAAVRLLQRHGPAPPVELLAALMRDADADVRAAAVFAAGVQGAPGGRGRRDGPA